MASPTFEAQVPLASRKSLTIRLQNLTRLWLEMKWKLDQRQSANLVKSSWAKTKHAISGSLGNLIARIEREITGFNEEFARYMS
jgi:hypothetical protein